MKIRSLFYSALTFTTLVLMVLISGCERDTEILAPAEYPQDSGIFSDVFGPSVQYQSFGNSKVDALEIDNDVVYSGESSMRIKIPNVGDPTGAYAGASLVAAVPRDLSGYDAVTFWAKGSKDATLNEIGLGNDNTGSSKYVVTSTNHTLTTAWAKYIIPIPDPSKLKAEQGLFWFAEGPENGLGYYLWIDEIQFEKLGTIAQPRATFSTVDEIVFPGDSLTVQGASVTLNVAGVDQTIGCMPGYFSWTSSDPTVATVNAYGVVKGVGLGTAVIKGSFKSQTISDSLVVSVEEAPPAPTVAAPTPTDPQSDVISLFSNAYTNVPVDSWMPGWEFSTTAYQELQIAGNDVKLYTKLNFNGIVLESSPVNATEMKTFHMDIWTPNSTALPASFKVLLVDMGPDGTIGGNDNLSHELSFTASTDPALKSQEWVSLEVPLSAFTGLTSRSKIAQIVISGDIPTVYVDNLYFTKREIDGGGGGGGSAPTTAAPTPTDAASDVISMFSNAYTDVTIDSWATGWEFSTAVLADIQINGDDVKQYTSLNFNGIEFITNQIDASEMKTFHMDIWTPDATTSAEFKVKLIDFGADGAYSGGDDKEHELTFTASTTPALATESWVSLEVPLSAFSGLTTKSNLAQMVISGDLPTVFVDNVYFTKRDIGGGGGGGGDTEPTTAAPTPTASAVNVISIFSDAYTNVAGTNLNPDWGQATSTSEVLVAGNNTLKMAGLDYQGIELGSSQNLSSYEKLHLDYWTTDASSFQVFLISTGSGEQAYDVTITKDQWVSLDIELSEYTGKGLTITDIIQFKFVGNGTIFVDNIYFEAAAGGGGVVPTTTAPTPTDAAGDVISLFSNAYTDVPVDNWATGWEFSTAVLADIQINGDDVKQYTSLNFNGIEFVTNQIDASAMKTFHMDIYTPSSTALPATFKVQLTDFGADGAFDGGDDASHEMVFTASTIPGLQTGTWISLEVSLSDFTGLTSRTHLAQLVISGDLPTVFIDNVYFTKRELGDTTPAPSGPAPTPTDASGDVISLFSNAYTDVTIDAWATGWEFSTAVLEEVQISGDDVLKYTDLNFNGIEFATNTIDATEMKTFHMDIWTPNSTAIPAAFKVMLIDFGADGAFDGGDDVSHEMSFTASTIPGLESEKWVSLEVSLAKFTNLTTKAHLAQIVISGDLPIVYVDNVYFTKRDVGSSGTVPTSAATAPTYAAGDVISLFSNAYTNITVDTWSADWDNANLEDTQIAGDDVKLYTDLVFSGIEFTTSTVDASDMTHISLDFWTPNPTTSGSFKIKLVDFGANGVWEEGGDNVEHEVILTASSTPALASETWVTLNIPLSDFTGLTTKGHVAQLIISGDFPTVYIDNVIFHK
ncbi:MAG: Ig-like domain-containing protein [Melioribacteraceae bacterium]|nr:Ig-like domain-containing protein [Melioribacteraceae bacterium]